MGILVYRDAAAASAAVATVFAAQIIEKPNSVLGFVTGPTQEGVFARLAGMTGSSLLDWSDVISFNVSEFMPASAQEESRRAYMHGHLFGKVNIRPENVRFPNVEAEDLKAACAAYEDEISDAGGIDLQLLGLGKTGNIGFNYPAREFVALTHAVPLPQQEAQQEQYFSLTMGVGSIMAAERIIMLVTGADKADAVFRMLNSSVSPAFPATTLQLHRRVTFVLDEPAAARL